jgi:hypothetical protein
MLTVLRLAFIAVFLWAGHVLAFEHHKDSFSEITRTREFWILMSAWFGAGLAGFVASKRKK